MGGHYILELSDHVAPQTRTPCENPTEEASEPLQRIRCPEAWKLVQGAGTIIGQLSTGIAYHADLEANVIAVKSFVDDDPTDIHGIGTFDAGSMVAPRNGIGVIGVAYQSALVSARITGPDGTATIESVVAATRWCFERGARVIWMPLASGVPHPDLEMLCAECISRNVLFISPTKGSPDGSPTYPGAYPGVLSVAGLTNKFSVADVYALERAVCGLDFGGNYYRDFCRAGALATGVAALVYAAFPSITSPEVREKIIASAVQVPEFASRKQVDALAAVTP